MVVLEGGGAISYKRGTPVQSWKQRGGVSLKCGVADTLLSYRGTSLIRKGPPQYDPPITPGTTEQVRVLLSKVIFFLKVEAPRLGRRGRRRRGRRRARCSLGRVFVIIARAQRQSLHTWSIFVVVNQHLVHAGRIDGPIEYS